MYQLFPRRQIESAADVRVRMRLTHERLQRIDLLLLLLDLRLLLHEGVHEYGGQLVIFHALDLPIAVAKREQRRTLESLLLKRLHRF